MHPVIRYGLVDLILKLQNMNAVVSDFFVLLVHFIQKVLEVEIIHLVAMQQIIQDVDKSDVNLVHFVKMVLHCYVLKENTEVFMDLQILYVLDGALRVIIVQRVLLLQYHVHIIVMLYQLLGNVHFVLQIETLS